MYSVNEVYLSVQGEGHRAGTANVFLRFQGCNLRCSGEMVDGVYQPLCDTEFASGRKLTTEALMDWIKRVAGKCRWIIATGGEPLLQLDTPLIDTFHSNGFQVAVETNGTIKAPDGIDYLVLSPKIAEHAIKIPVAHEIRYVRGYGQAIPKPACKAEHCFISPAFEGVHLPQDTLNWCIQLVKDNPQWRLSVQMHKFTNIR